MSQELGTARTSHHKVKALGLGSLSQHELMRAGKRAAMCIIPTLMFHQFLSQKTIFRTTIGFRQ